MKNVRTIFKKNPNFVTPLYRKVRPVNKVDNKNDRIISIDVDSTPKLHGNGIHVKRKIDRDRGVHYNKVSIKYKNNISELNKYLPSGYRSKADNLREKVIRNSKTVLPSLKLRGDKNDNKNIKHKRSLKYCNMLGIVENNVLHANEEIEEQDDTFNNGSIIVHRVPDTWLRVYPASKGQNETICSVIFRCIMCQIGLGSFLIFWTMLWVFIIQSFEGPHEMKVSVNFEDQQNQLIIDLATELRQITPLSPKWREAIVARIEEERRLTISAVGDGARLHPGHYWDVAGTFLFTVYVMTALGFGAPVPHTLMGRTSTLIYAALAVPTHVYLMLNASTCVVVQAEDLFHRVKMRLKDKRPFVVESPNCSRNSELKKTTSNIRKHIIRVARAAWWGRGVPLATLTYYALGALAFGASRSKRALDALMFPLEFTTTGGLEHVTSHVRILYGLYVEGAMCLLACALAALRRHSGAARAALSREHRLFVSEPCVQCQRVEPVPLVT